jgi:hypothetical protein
MALAKNIINLGFKSIRVPFRALDNVARNAKGGHVEKAECGPETFGRADGDDPSGARDLRRTMEPDRENTLENLPLSWRTGMRILMVYRRLLRDFSHCD